MATVLKQKLKFVSLPYRQRIGLIPMSVAIVLAWAATAFCFVFVAATIQYHVLVGSIALFLVCAFGLYLVFVTDVWTKASKHSYELTVDGDLIRLSTYDAQAKIRSIQEMSLRDVSSAEYYLPRDCSSLLLQGLGGSIELPLWAFGPDAEREIVAQVRARGAQIIGIPTDVVI
jgi:hypothetical protein